MLFQVDTHHIGSLADLGQVLDAVRPGTVVRIGWLRVARRQGFLTQRVLRADVRAK